MRRIAAFMIALAAALVVHHGAWDLRPPGHDVARLLGSTVSVDQGGPVTRLMTAVERHLPGDPRTAKVVGFILLAGLGAATARFVRRSDGRTHADLAAAALIGAAAPACLAVTAIAGHATLLSATAALTLLDLATRYSANPALRIVAGAFSAALLVGVPSLDLPHDSAACATAAADRVHAAGLAAFAPMDPAALDRRTLTAAAAIAVAVLAAAALSGKRVARTGIILTLGSTAAVALSSGVACDGGDPGRGIAAVVGMAIVVAGALSATPRGSDRRVAAWAIIALCCGLNFLAARAVTEARRAAVNDDEVRAILSEIGHLPPVVEDALVLGIPAVPERAAAEARISSPARPGLSVHGLAAGREGEIDITSLIAPSRRTLLLEWRPRLIGPPTTPPDGWSLAPWIGLDPGTLAAAIRLDAPADNATFSTERPKSMADDHRFVFATGPGFVLGPDDAFVFYSYMSGAQKPKGRQMLTARRLEESVLMSEAAPDGGRIWSWRPAVRPGEGEDGVPLDDTELDIAGRTLVWTVGVVRDLGPDEHHEPHRLGTDSSTRMESKERPVSAPLTEQPHSGRILFPHSLAAFRRVRFQDAGEISLRFH